MRVAAAAALSPEIRQGAGHASLTAGATALNDQEDKCKTPAEANVPELVARFPGHRAGNLMVTRQPDLIASRTQKR
jgi:hypothetical protein